MSRFTLSSLLFLYISAAYAQQMVQIDFKLSNFVGDTLLSAYYMGDKAYVSDTIVVKNGLAKLTRKEELEGGMYLLVHKGAPIFNFILSKGDQKFSMEADVKNVENTMKVKGSKENQIFHEYMLFLKQMKAKSEEIYTKKEDLLKLDDMVKERQLKIIKDNPTSFTAKIIASTFQPNTSQMLTVDGKVDSVAQFYYYKAHYFDDFDFSEHRFVRTNILKSKFMYYLEKLTTPHADSIIVSVDYILGKAQANKEVYKVVVVELLNHYAASKVICMDKVYVHIADKYYCSPQAPFGGAFWVKQEQLDKICTNANELRTSMCYAKAPNLKLNDLNGNPKELYAIQAKYTVVFFWDPDCHTCKKYSERMMEVYDSLKMYGVEVFGICSKNIDEYDKCKKKADEMQLKWTNVGDPYNTGRSKILYNVKSNPQIYLLDKDKKILYKRLDVDQLIDIVKNMEKGR